MDYVGYNLYFLLKYKQDFVIKMWYILYFYFSTIEYYFQNASYLYLLKLN